MSTLEDWTDQVCADLGIEGLIPRQEATTLVLDLARDVAHGVARPAAPLTAFLLGLAAGRSDDPRTAAATMAGRVGELARGWSDADA